MILQPSPNFDDRKTGKVKYLILHYTGMATGAEALARLCDAEAKVSAHYLIEEDGRVFVLVPESARAWHAGVAAWGGDRDINELSIGIELVNPGHDSSGYKGDYRPFPPEQMGALIALCKDILSRHKILPWHILGHSDVAPARKSDPGELFDWKFLASQAVGLWPEGEQGSSVGTPVHMTDFQRKLADYGYEIDITGKQDPQTQAVVMAFQRHFRPTKVTGQADPECCSLLDGLLSARQNY